MVIHQQKEKGKEKTGIGKNTILETYKENGTKSVL